MRLHTRQTDNRTGCPGFTLVEVLVALLIFALASAGLIYGYVVSNRLAEWSAMSLAAQSTASQGAERARSANWRPYYYPPATGPGTMDELPPGTNGAPVIVDVDYLDIPTKGTPGKSDFDSWVTNYVWVTEVSSNPHLRQIRSDAVWTFPLTHQTFTNTIILLRAPDQL